MKRIAYVLVSAASATFLILTLGPIVSSVPTPPVNYSNTKLLQCQDAQAKAEVAIYNKSLTASQKELMLTKMDVACE